MCVWIVLGCLHLGVSQNFPCDFDIDCSEINTDLKITIESPATLSMGDQFCAEFTVSNFEYIISMQFDIMYDPSVLQFDPGNINFGNCLDGLTVTNFNPTNGNIRFLYFNPNVEGVCCMDGSTIFELCFEVIGEPLDNAFIDIDVEEIGYSLGFNAPDICFTLDDICIVPLNTELECPDLSIISSFCYPTTGNDDGSIVFTACGGTGPYMYAVTLVGPGTLISSGMIASAGVEIGPNIDPALGNLILFEQYLITITDATGAMTTRIIFFDQEGNQIDIDEITVMEPTCFNRQNGVIEISASGGQPAYEYFWSNNQFGNNRISDLPVGNYSVTVEDNTGCSEVANFVLALDTLKLNYEVLDSASCMGNANGRIKLTAEGGRPFTTAPDTYQFQSDNTPTDCKILTGLVGGNELIIQVQDDPAGFCVVKDTLEIPYKDGFEVVELINTGIECNGDRVATIELFATLVSSIIAVLRDENGQIITDPSIMSTTVGGNVLLLENLPAGTYFIDIEAQTPAQFAGCLVQYELIILEPDVLIFEDDGFIPPDCGGNPGSLSYTLYGGGGTLNLTMNGGAVPISQLVDLGNDMFQVIDLNGGMYDLLVEDGNGCTAELSYTLPPGGTLALEIDTLQNLECGGMNTGALIVQVLGGCSNCDYEWQDIDGNFLAGGNQLINLGAGCYTAVVTDNDQGGCTNMITACLSQQDGIEYTESLTPPNCTEGEDGSIGIIITQGEAPVNFSWEGFPQVNGSVLGPIPAGLYCVTIADANFCTIETCIELEDPDSLSMEIIEIFPAQCNGDNSGQLNVSGANSFNGMDFYNFIVFDENGDEYTSASGGGMVSITGLAAGNYTILVTDGQCAALETLSFEILEPEAITVDLDNTILIEPSCFGICDGQLSVEAIGGSGSGYEYSWVSNGLMSNTITDLCGDQWHYIDISDDAGCVHRDSVFLDEPDTLIVNIDPNATENPNCFDSDDGFINLTILGGTPDFDIQWSSGITSTTSSANELGIGIYSATVTDVNGCMDIVTHELFAPPPVSAVINQPIEPMCFGSPTEICVEQASGGSGTGYSFSIVTGGEQFPLDTCISVIADTYTVTVFDDAGCSVKTTLIIDQPEPLFVDLGDDFIEVELGDSTAILQANINAINPVTIEWNPSDAVECIDPNCQIVAIAPTETTLYEVIITDSDGCQASDEITVLIGENRNVYIPNAFSPNGDGSNDDFALFVGEGVEEIEHFGIFDRWGNLMYEVDNLPAAQATQIRWDGKFKEKEVVPGIYVYRARVKFIDEQFITYKGTFTLMR